MSLGMLLKLVGVALVACVTVGVAANVVRGSGQAGSQSVRVTNVVDGDTVDVSTGERVRLIGIDTPEREQCGYDRASEFVRHRVVGKAVTLVDPTSVRETDRYGRALRYLQVDGADVGLALIKRGMAVARYDSVDGYEHHPLQSRYRSTDSRVPSLCR